MYYIFHDLSYTKRHLKESLAKTTVLSRPWSEVVFNKTNDYGGVQVKAGEETIKFMTRGEKFDTVRGMDGRQKILIKIKTVPLHEQTKNLM